MEPIHRSESNSSSEDSIEEGYPKPSLLGYTIYSKSGCPNCKKVKELLNKINDEPMIVEYNCDDYLIENKEEFLEFIYKCSGKNHRTFPIVFLKGEFIGGYTDTQVYIDKKNAFSFPDSIDF